MKATGCVFLAAILTVHSERRRNHIKLELSLFGGARLALSVGTEPHVINTQLDTKSANLILMGTGCLNAHQQVRCPTYCSNAAFRSAYCSDLCEKVSANELSIRCGHSHLFNSSKSTTFEDLGVEVVESFADYRSLYGQMAKEEIRVITAKVEKVLPIDDWGMVLADDVEMLSGNRVEFVRGFSFDRRYLVRTGGGVFGLGPQPPNGRPPFVAQLKASGLVGRAVVSVQRGNWPLLLSSFSVLSGSIMLGALDKYCCHNWRRIPSQRGWEFEITNVRFAGWEIGGMHFGRIALDHINTAVPKHLAERLVAERLFTYDAEIHVYSAAKNAPAVHLEFTAGNHSIKVGPLEKLAAFDGERRYGDESQWIFSTRLLNSYCFGYDYEVGAVMWGERRLSIVL